jgi:hypothetical protein
MFVEVFIFIATGILNLIMGVTIILGGGPTKKQNLPFAFYSISSFLLSLTYYFIYTTRIAVFDRIAYSIGALLPMFLLLWAYNFHSKNSKLIWRSLIYLIGLSLAAAPLINGLLIDNIRKSPNLGLIESRGPLFPFYVIFFLTVYAFVLFVLLHSFRYGDKKTRKQTGLILTGFSIYGALVITFSLLLPSLGYDRLTDLDIPSSVIFIFFTGYAIVQYKWMNVKMVAVEVLSVVICSVALMDILFADSFEQRFYKSFYFLVLATISAYKIRGVLNANNGRRGLRGISDVLD